jgi:hypothetical protein
MSADKVRLPKADRLMTAVLLAMMLGADVLALAFRSEQVARAWPALIIMPGTLVLVLSSYNLSIVVMRRTEAWKTGIGAATAVGVMGRTLVAMGITLTVAHAGMLAYATRLIGSADMALVFRLFAVALGLNFAFLGNTMAKRMTASRMLVIGNPRAMGWVAVVSGAAIAVVALTAPFERLTPILLTIAFVPCVFNFANMFVHWRERRRAS